MLEVCFANQTIAVVVDRVVDAVKGVYHIMQYCY